MTVSERAIGTTFRHLYAVRNGAKGECTASDEIVAVSVALLRMGPSIRNHDSAETEPTVPTEQAAWPPIVVRRGTHTVVDGHRRVLAARSMGIAEVNIRWFDGDETDAVVEFVRLNLKDDVGLDRSERREAARRILCLHPEWSDRRIGELCRISPKTVAEVRAILREAVGDSQAMGAEARVGRDGRVRPLDSRAQRARIVEAIKDDPRASLRAIAGPIGVSPETVRRVRAAMAEEGSLDCEAFVPFDILHAGSIPRRQRTWLPDSAFTSGHEAAEVAEFLERTDTSTLDPEEHSRAIPLSRIYEVADEARRRAAFWLRLAESVENRSRKACF